MFALILQAPSEVMRYYGEQLVDVARKALNAGEYRAMPPVPYDVALTGSDVAEEMFDLTNNPSRQEERVQMYGRHRSLSVGDVVIVAGAVFLCGPIGWEELM